jgi:hypothetical protein
VGNAKLKTVDILPLSAPAKKFRFLKEIKTLDAFRLLLLETLHGGEIFKNHNFRKQHSIGISLDA